MANYKERDITRLNIQKIPGETADAYQAFLVYARLQFNDRNIENVSTITGYALDSVKRWGKEWNWQERANICDAEEEILIREDRLNLQKRENVRYVNKSREIKDKAFEVSEKMIDAALNLLGNVKFIDQIRQTGEVETKDGRMVPTHTEIVFKAKVSDIPRLADVGMKIGQLAAGLPTEIVESNLIDISKTKNLTREELTAQIEQEDKEIQRLQGEKKLKLVGSNK